jgi:hypothetical protein
MTIPVTSAETFKTFLPFIKNWDKKKDISYHMQYLEYLYKVKKTNDPKSTTLSLSNKAIIIEFFCITEAVIDAMLCQLRVEDSSGGHVDIDIDEYTSAEKLFFLAKKYRVIDATVHSQINQLKSTRNRIHIKRPVSGKPEYSEYTPSLLGGRETIYKAFFEYLFEKHDPSLTQNFPWPWNAKP